MLERVVDIGDDRQRLVLDKPAGKQLRAIAHAGAAQGDVQATALDLCQQRLAGVFDDLERHLRLDAGQLRHRPHQQWHRAHDCPHRQPAADPAQDGIQVMPQV
ncbi:hypothetical protein D3C76_515350 [compost metagenome]